MGFPPFKKEMVAAAYNSNVSSSWNTYSLQPEFSIITFHLCTFLNRMNKTNNLSYKIGTSMGFLIAVSFFVNMMYFILGITQRIPGTPRVHIYFLLSGLFIFIIYTLRPINMKSGFFQGLKFGFKDFGSLVTFIVNAVLLTIVYFLGVGVTSVAAKIAGKKFLQYNQDIHNTKLKSFWDDYDLALESQENYYRQF